VVRMHDLGEFNGTYFITMEFMPGVTVQELLDKRGRLTVESTLAIGTQMCEALAVAHELQIIHRDIKPGNALVHPDGSLKVMDFGIARSVDQDALRLTAGGLIVGTPQYMAPEQLRGKPVDARADLFAVGVMLYECLAGQPPFTADSPLGLLTAIAEQAATPLDQLVADLPPRLAPLIHQQLSFEAADRSQSAMELARKLHEIDSGVE
jgi:serine/threonine protein kinase